MLKPKKETRMRRSKLSGAFRALRPFALVAAAGLAVGLGARAFWNRESSPPPLSLPAPIDTSRPIISPGVSSGASQESRESLQAIGEKIRGIKEDVGKISDNLGKLKETTQTPGNSALKTASDLNESIKKFRARMDSIATAFEPGGKVDTAVQSVKRVVAPDGPLATMLRAAEEKTAELAKQPRTPPKPHQSPPKNR